MQVGIPVAYSVCEVKLGKINHWICVHTEDFIVGILKYKLEIGLIIGCAKTLNEATVHSHYNEIINMLQALGQTVLPRVDVVVVLFSSSCVPYMAQCFGVRRVERNSFKMQMA